MSSLFQMNQLTDDKTAIVVLFCCVQQFAELVVPQGQFVHVSHQAPARTPRPVLGVSGGTIPASSPALKHAATLPRYPAPPSHSKTCSVALPGRPGMISRHLTLSDDVYLYRVEGCLPVCPAHMVLDEVTSRCVFVEDCECPLVLSLMSCWSMIILLTPLLLFQVLKVQ